jgi:hypothetical protein
MVKVPGKKRQYHYSEFKSFCLMDRQYPRTILTGGKSNRFPAAACFHHSRNSSVSGFLVTGEVQNFVLECFQIRYVFRIITKTEEGNNVFRYLK